MSRIAVYLPSLRGGGAERVMVTLANGFAERGHQVDLVLARAEGPYLTEVGPGVRVINLDKGRVLASMLPLVHYLRRERPAAMLSALNHANIVAILARMFALVPTRLVVSERNSLASLGTGHRARMFRALMRGFYPLADKVVSVSRDGARELIEQLGLAADKVTSIPNPVEIERITQLSKELPAHPWAEGSGSPLILAVGRLEPQKDYPTLLQAFAILRRQRECRLAVLGEGGLRSALEQQIQDLSLGGSVALLGFEPNPFGWMARCDVYVMSSRFEGFPNSLVQAMACGARVVSTNCPTGPGEILEDGKWGALVPVGDTEALATAMGSALDDLDPPNVMQRAAGFAVSKAIDAYEECLWKPLYQH